MLKTVLKKNPVLQLLSAVGDTVYWLEMFVVNVKFLAISFPGSNTHVQWSFSAYNTSSAYVMCPSVQFDETIL